MVRNVHHTIIEGHDVVCSLVRSWLTALLLHLFWKDTNRLSC
jgi:hypothetical protein